MTLELKTTRDGAGAITTTTPGAQDSAISGLFAELIRKKLLGPQGPARPTGGVGARMERAPVSSGQYGGGASGLSAAPSSAPKVLATRMRSVPQNPYDAMSRIPGGIGGTGNTNTARPERFIEGVGWEFDGDPAMNPSGPSGGISGGGNPELTRSTPNLQARMPAYATGSPEDGMDLAPLTGLPRYRAPIEPAPRSGSYYKATKGKN